MNSGLLALFNFFRCSRAKTPSIYRRRRRQWYVPFHRQLSRTFLLNCRAAPCFVNQSVRSVKGGWLVDSAATCAARPSPRATAMGNDLTCLMVESYWGQMLSRLRRRRKRKPSPSRKLRVLRLQPVWPPPGGKATPSSSPQTTRQQCHVIGSAYSSAWASRTARTKNRGQSSNIVA